MICDLGGAPCLPMCSWVKYIDPLTPSPPPHVLHRTRVKGCGMETPTRLRMWFDSICSVKLDDHLMRRVVPCNCLATISPDCWPFSYYVLFINRCAEHSCLRTHAHTKTKNNAGPRQSCSGLYALARNRDTRHQTITGYQTITAYQTISSLVRPFSYTASSPRIDVSSLERMTDLTLRRDAHTPHITHHTPHNMCHHLSERCNDTCN